MLVCYVGPISRISTIRFIQQTSPHRPCSFVGQTVGGLNRVAFPQLGVYPDDFFVAAGTKR